MRRSRRKYTPPDVRRINGQRWVHAGTSRDRLNKRKAQRDAAVARTKGWMARVVQAGGRHWVYVRSKKRK